MSNEAKNAWSVVMLFALMIVLGAVIGLGWLS
ncbi:membrane protein [Mycobacterium phage Aminay]|uniref:Membrane protein n=1 Tax=Mycobacterium phage Aminay TaxID=2250291 RepID=A0A345KV36_9CAUD|nr:membrane protein [Mycobacterium phage Aminay]AXH46888.1 membrane protein [Mycobacterium phage Aminay]